MGGVNYEVLSMYSLLVSAVYIIQVWLYYKLCMLLSSLPAEYMIACTYVCMCVCVCVCVSERELNIIFNSLRLCGVFQCGNSAHVGSKECSCTSSRSLQK